MDLLFVRWIDKWITEWEIRLPCEIQRPSGCVFACANIATLAGWVGYQKGNGDRKVMMPLSPGGEWSSSMAGRYLLESEAAKSTQEL